MCPYCVDPIWPCIHLVLPERLELSLAAYLALTSYKDAVLPIELQERVFIQTLLLYVQRLQELLHLVWYKRSVALDNDVLLRQLVR